MIRRIFAVLILALVVVAVVGDRLAVSAAQRAVAIKVRDAALLHENPTVKITGFPFLTQALRGKYTKITIVAHDIHRDGVRIDTINGTFYGVHVGLRNALAGKVGSVPIDRGTGSILMTYVDLNRYLKSRRLTVSAQGNALTVAGQPLIAGRRVSVTGAYDVGVSGRSVTFTPLPGSVSVAGLALTAPVAAAANADLTLSIDTGTLPFGLVLSTAAVLPTGVRVNAAARGLTVPVPADASSTTS